MVATRRGAKKAPEVAPAPSSTLNAPPKRGGKKKAVTEEASAPAPAPATAKSTKTTAVKRKARPEPEPEHLEPTVAKTAVATKATRTVKVQTEEETAPVAPKRATRGRKVEEPAIVQDAPKPAATRTRKTAATKNAPAPNVAEPAVVEEIQVDPQEPKPTRKALARKAIPTKPATKKAAPPVVEETTVVEPTKPVPRVRKTTAPVIAPRATRARNAPHVPQESPLKAPARKRVKKAGATPVATVEHESYEELFAEFPIYPTTPSHIVAPITSREAIAELPNYPSTPSHIVAPLSSREALAELPNYPTTPAHIVAPISSREALAEMPGYPDTPAHIKAPISAMNAMAEMPDYPKTPAHIVVDAPKTESGNAQDIETLEITTVKFAERLPASVDVSTTPTTMTPVMVPATPYHGGSPEGMEIVELPGTPPVQIVWGVTNQEAFEELPGEYPATPIHISAPVTSKDALAELPGYPKTPVHINAPITPRRAFAELPDYPTTPSLALEAAIQAEITASVKKQTPSPRRFLGFEEPGETVEISEATEFSEFTEVTVADAGEAPLSPSRPSMQLAPFKLAPSFTAAEPASPKKSALRSPQKVMDAKTPKKTVAWTDVQADESDLFLADGILQGLVFYVDVTRNGREQNFLFRGLLEDLGAKVVQDISHPSLSHVLFKDGCISTLETCLASKGAIKCVNVGWVLDSEAQKKRMDENSYMVDLSVAKPLSPLPTATAMKPFTPAKTPSRYALPPSSQCKMPSTPTSSEFDRSFDDDKENCDVGPFFDNDKSPLAPRTVPNKKSSSFLFARSAMKTPSKPIFLGATPSKQPFSAVKPAVHAFTTAKKRPAEASSSFFNSSLGPPKKLRLF
ncbi:brct domain-containing [Pyrenophora seminiperda CCB06]|uniref:Brct domain-containing n=1 Tax=Pyrenophora seminiperda CCB06 TaxID=1302712 RepID=A0A3M7MD56_9PLEO|nr:brct domain-containing [Pyrenophora seminiperda CCB06]